MNRALQHDPGVLPWRPLLAVIACISVVGLALGLTIPLVSLVLETRGVDSTGIGLLSAMPALAILLCSALVPPLVARIGARAALYLGILVCAGSTLALPVSDCYAWWLLLRFAMGAATGVLFTVSESWINQLAAERHRGKLVALYATMLALCMALGPALIGLTGHAGALPFVVAAAILGSAALPLALLGCTSAAPLGIGGRSAFGVTGFVRLAPVLCAAVMLFAYWDGMTLAMLPLFGLDYGYAPAEAALMVTALIAGNIVLQLPIGWLADHLDRGRLLVACGFAALAGALALPLVASTPWLLWPTLVLAGAAAGGLYTLAIILVGQRYRGAELVAANAAIGMLWGLGSLLGPLSAGLAMRGLSADGLPAALALATALFLALCWRRSAADTTG
ncbi:MAG TPA: MFS transporter [Candidatus Competibacteraceae bacterium]|nr:MFS transporter [Candidatus Competibacteraceae bacterium]